MVWPFWIALALVAVAFAPDKRPALAILGGLIAMRLSPVLPTDLRMLGEAGLWVGIGGLIITRFAAPVCGALVVACGLCYIWARVGGYEVALGSAPFVASDVLGVLALAVAAYGERDGGGRVRFMDRYCRRWRFGFSNGLGHDAPVANCDLSGRVHVHTCEEGAR